MDSASSNPYEQQLYSVFKTFDVGDSGALDRPAVLQLCDTLQLESRGAALVDSLFERRAERVTFAQFRSGLLSVLGEPAAPPDHSDDDSSGREVAPRLVVGAKRYGRRSRPQRAAPGPSARPRGASESRLDSARASLRPRCKRSASAMESRDDAADLDHDRPVDRARALQLCRGLRMGGVDGDLVDRVFDTSAVDEMSVGEFFDRLNASLSSSIAASMDGDGAPGGDAVASEAVAEAWERAGVQHPRRLLAELGFASAALSPLRLERALDDELRALPVAPEPQPDARVLLLLAALALARLGRDAALRCRDVARAERDKLRDDLAEANARARMLAQDVDENHARIEAELQAGLRQVEARHAEAERAAAADAAAERERAAAARLALHEETARRVDVEARLRSETAALRDQILELQERATTLETRAAGAERDAARAADEAREAVQRETAAAERARAEAAEWAARLGELRAENQRLRDRVDELAASLEASARCTAAESARAPSWREEVAMAATAESSTSPHNESPKSSLITREMKLNLKQYMAKLEFILYNEKLPNRIENDCPQCVFMRNTLANIRKTVQEFQLPMSDVSSGVEASSQTELHMELEVEVLQRELDDTRQQHEEDKQNMSSVILELERGAARLRGELERAEEYWAAKLDDERDAFADEQRAGDERLAELVAKIAEYERQFARPVLPPIDESAALERQVTELESEFSAYRADREALLAAKAQELQQLQRRLEQLERRAPAPAADPALQASARAAWGAAGGAAWGAREAGALRARAARAERAAQRLHARLAAADLLVKDLYIENCRLAHLPPHARLP